MPFLTTSFATLQKIGKALMLPVAVLPIASIYAAFDFATLAFLHKDLHGGDGIVGEAVEATIRNIGVLASKGMEQTDEVILRIMTSESGHGKYPM